MNTSPTLKSDAMQEYMPDGSYLHLDDNTRALMREAFMAGRKYEASLFSDVLNTIVQEVKRYRSVTKEAGGE